VGFAQFDSTSTHATTMSMLDVFGMR